MLCSIIAIIHILHTYVNIYIILSYEPKTKENKRGELFITEEFRVKEDKHGVFKRIS